MIRQSIGLGATDYAQQHVPECRTSANSELVQILHPLIPKSSENEIIKSVDKFVKKSIAVKSAMCQEQAFYRCSWARNGDVVDPRYVETIEEETGHVFFCVFPGLERIIKKDGAELVVVVVKACAILQTSTTAKE